MRNTRSCCSHVLQNSITDHQQRAQLSGVAVTGVMRLIPLPDHRLIAVAFAKPPDVKLQLEARFGWLGIALDDVTMLRKLIQRELSKVVTEPRRLVVPLDVRPMTSATFQSAALDVSVLSVDCAAWAHRDVLIVARAKKVRTCTARAHRMATLF